MLRLALTKGRIEDDAVKLLKAAGYGTSELDDKGRRLLFKIDNADMEVVLVKAADVITYIEHGVCDMGIVGKDTIMECGRTFYEILDLGFGKCRFALAGPRGGNFYAGYGEKSVATKYPNVTKAFLARKGTASQIIKIDGSAELAPLLGLADAIVDIVETGSTLKENGLEIYEEVAPVSARLIVNTASIKLKKHEADIFAGRLRKALNGGGKE